jgi:hypothetical protein
MPYLGTTPSFLRIPSYSCFFFLTACISIDVIFILSDKNYSSFRLRPLNNYFLFFMVLFVFIKELVLFITAQTIINLNLMQTLPLLFFLLGHKTLYIRILTRFLNFFFNIWVPFNALGIKLCVGIVIPFVMETFQNRLYLWGYLRIAAVLCWP